MSDRPMTGQELVFAVLPVVNDHQLSDPETPAMSGSDVLCCHCRRVNATF